MIEIIYLDLQYNVFYLEDARSIAMTSFFSLKSVSHLDLQVNERNLHISRRNDRVFYFKKKFFCTEEGFRNHVVPERRLLYSLNLDLPEGREYSNLRSGPAPADLPENTRSLFVAVRGHDYFFKETLVLLIQLVLEQTDCKFKRMKWMVNFRPLMSIWFSPSVKESFAVTLYRECGDSSLAMQFLEKFIDIFTFRSIELKVLEHFLCSARLLGFQIRGKMTENLSLTDYFIYYHCFRVIPSILKYDDAAYYTDSSYVNLKTFIYKRRYLRRNRTAIENFNRLENSTSKSRLYRIMQIIHIYKHHEVFIMTEFLNRSEVTEALRLVWRSIPDAYVSRQEMTMASRWLRYFVPSNDIRQAYSFYETAILRIVPYPEPRLLTQYCKTVIRRSLCYSRRWLPDGIELLNLPPRLKSFLNLKRDDLRPDNFKAS